MKIRELSGHDTFPLSVPETGVHTVPDSSVITLLVANPPIVGA